MSDKETQARERYDARLDAARAKFGELIAEAEAEYNTELQAARDEYDKAIAPE